MHEIKFYRRKNGETPVLDYIRELEQGTGKDSRIKLEKINDYIETLKEHGTAAGKPYVDHLGGDIFELRPLRDRILFAAWVGDAFLLLHIFMKQTRKTPKNEIEKAKRELQDFKEREAANEHNV